jgi:HSP20 family protein
MIFNKKNKIAPAEEVATEEPATWIDYEEPEIEGQLAIDVYQDEKRIIIKSTIAGVKPEDLKISLHHDLLTIKGVRSHGQTVKEEDYLYRECYWGSFSRSIILPTEVDNKKVDAELENGVLTVTLHKTAPASIDIKIKD